MGRDLAEGRRHGVATGAPPGLRGARAKGPCVAFWLEVCVQPAMPAHLGREARTLRVLSLQGKLPGSLLEADAEGQQRVHGWGHTAQGRRQSSLGGKTCANFPSERHTSGPVARALLGQGVVDGT